MTLQVVRLQSQKLTCCLGQVKLSVWILDHDSPGSEIANSKAYMMLGQASGVGSGPVFELKLYSPPKREESF
jgi:hypothetical protein